MYSTEKSITRQFQRVLRTTEGKIKINNNKTRLMLRNKYRNNRWQNGRNEPVQILKSECTEEGRYSSWNKQKK